MRAYLCLVLIALNFSCNTERKEMTKEEYAETSKFLWQTYVPKSGQAETVQGELIRAIEKIADEAQRNGNINFNKDCHVILIEYLRKYLTDNDIFDKRAIKQINHDLDILLIEDEPYTEEDIYERINNRIVDWYLKNKKLVHHVQNLKLNC